MKTKGTPKKATGPSKEDTNTSPPFGLVRTTALESDVGTLTTKVSGLEDSLKEISAALSSLAEKQAAPPVLPRTDSVDARVEALRQARSVGDLGQSRRVKDLRNPRATDTGFQPNDIVEITKESPMYDVYQVNADGGQAREGQEKFPAQGLVVNYMYTKRSGQRKYKVQFAGFDSPEGMTEKELKLCST